MSDQPEYGSAREAFLNAYDILRELDGLGVGGAHVDLYVDGSGSLTIPREEFPEDDKKRRRIEQLVGSVRYWPGTTERDIVISSCGGFRRIR